MRGKKLKKKKTEAFHVFTPEKLFLNSLPEVFNFYFISKSLFFILKLFDL